MAKKKATTSSPTITATPKKAPAKKGPEKKSKSDGLRKPQIRVLQALGKSKQPLSRKEISDKGEVDLAMLNSYIGSHDTKIRAKNDKKVMPSLLTLGYVKASDGESGVVYSITAAGKKALEGAKSDN